MINLAGILASRKKVTNLTICCIRGTSGFNDISSVDHLIKYDVLFLIYCWTQLKNEEETERIIKMSGDCSSGPDWRAFQVTLDRGKLQRICEKFGDRKQKYRDMGFICPKTIFAKYYWTSRQLCVWGLCLTDLTSTYILLCPLR